MGSIRGYRPRRQQLALSTLLLVLLYLGVLATIPSLPSPVQNAATSLIGPVMAIQLIMLPFLARDVDHLVVRNALSANATGVACAYAAATGLFTTQKDLNEARTLARVLKHAPAPALWTAREILDGHPTVERSVPPLLQRMVEVVLLVLGAIGGNLFAAAFAASGGTDASPVLALVFVVAAPAVTLAAAAGVDRVQTLRERMLLDRVRERALNNPVGLLQALPISNKGFRRKFLSDLQATVHLVEAPRSGLVAYSYLASVEPEGGRWRPSAHDAFTFTLWQFGLGLLLGGPATLAAGVFQ